MSIHNNFIPQIPQDSGSPIGSIIAFAGYIGNPNSLPADKKTNYNSNGIQPKGFGLPEIEPYNWMVCNGRKLNVKDYPKLFMALGFRYVQKTDNDGNTPPDTPFDSKYQDDPEIIFRIPDYRGQFLRMVSGTAPWPNNAEYPDDNPDNSPDPDVRMRKLPYGEKDSGVGSIQADALQTHQHQYSKAEKGVTPSEKGASLVVPPTGFNSQTSTPTDIEPPTNPPTRGVITSSETRAKNIYVYYLIKFA